MDYLLLLLKELKVKKFLTIIFFNNKKRGEELSNDIRREGYKCL